MTLLPVIIVGNILRKSAPDRCSMLDNPTVTIRAFCDWENSSYAWRKHEALSTPSKKKRKKKHQVHGRNWEEDFWRIKDETARSTPKTHSCLRLQLALNSEVCGISYEAQDRCTKMTPARPKYHTPFIELQMQQNALWGRLQGGACAHIEKMPWTHVWKSRVLWRNNAKKKPFLEIQHIWYDVSCSEMGPGFGTLSKTVGPFGSTCRLSGDDCV